MSIYSTAGDEVVLERETSEGFERSSQLFYAADKLRYESQDETGAEKTYREAMAATTTHGVFYHLAQGQIYSMRQNMEYALTEFEIATEITDKRDSVFINLGLTYRKIAGRLRSLNLSDKAAEMTRESVAALEHALEVNPSNAGGWSALAITYLTMGEEHRNDTERCLDRALSLDPSSYLALTALANLRRQQGRKEEARRHAPLTLRGPRTVRNTARESTHGGKKDSQVVHCVHGRRGSGRPG
jgi:tetratricopeptide (TPR) repeat protein